jgi:hypothetical protein
LYYFTNLCSGKGWLLQAVGNGYLYLHYDLQFLWEYSILLQFFLCVGMLMDLQLYFDVHRIMPAFTFRDIQTANTILHWLRSNSFTVDDLSSYCTVRPFAEQLDTIGYFRGGGNEVHSKDIKEFEKSLPKDIKRVLRKERLSRTVVGKIPT